MSDVASDAGQPVFRLLYRSRDQIPADQHKTELGALFSTARSNNKRRDVTGALLVHDRWFVQALEGDEATVRQLFAHIETDPRHDSVSVLEAGAVPARVFSRWSMADVSADVSQPDVFLIAHKDGIAPAAPLRPTPEQQELLQKMRASARGEQYTDRPDLQRQPAARGSATSM